MLQHYQVNKKNYSFSIDILFIIYIELGSKISSFFSSRKDETNNNTTDENILTVRKTFFFSPRESPSLIFFLE